MVLGWALVVLGLAALVLPGPGLILLAAGLAVLAHHYAWARRRLQPVQRRARQAARTTVKTPAHLALAVLIALGTVGTGLVWGLRPAAPGWWPLSERWWLPGGWGVASSLMASGVLALGLVVWSWLRFRPGQPEAEPEPEEARTG
nr:PGPGW domain-containing protein [Auraticoccus cholistanensis]